MNKAVSFNGCGKMINVSYRKFGLCPSCYAEFLTETEQGKVIMQKAILKGRNQLKTVERKKTKQLKDSLYTPDKYRSKILQPTINKIARLIDYGCSCIATNNFGKMNGGHRISVGANRSTSLNLHNIHIQSFQSNTFKSGDNIKYDIGIVERYGKEYLEFLNSLHQTPALKLSLSELQELQKISLSIVKELEQNQILKTPIQRIDLRNYYNQKLGIYDNQFSTFKH